MGPTGRLVTIKRSGVDGPHFPLSLSTCLFGRGIECDIRIQLPVVSKQHCKIEISGQKATLFNFSATNPTQVNGSVIDEPVQLKHGDMITIVDRSFRYENESHQNGSKTTEFPGQRREQRHEQASPRRGPRSDSSSDSDGNVRDPNARSEVAGEGVSGPVPTEGVGAARGIPHASGEPVARKTPDVPSSALPGDDGRKAAGPAAGEFREDSSVTSVSGDGELTCPSTRCLEKSGENESPFRQLYESLKEELDVKSEKENVLQNRRKSGSRSHRTTDNGSAGGSQDAAQLRVSPKPGRRSGPRSQSEAGSASGDRGRGRTEAGRTDAGPAQTPRDAVGPRVAPRELTKSESLAPCPQQNSSRPGPGGDRTRGGDSVSLGPRVSLGAGGGPPAPERILTRTQTQTATRDDSADKFADKFGNTPEKALSKKRRSGVPPNADMLAVDTETQAQAPLSPLHAQAERKVPDGPLSTPEPLGAGSAGLRSADVSNFPEAVQKMEGVPSKRRRVSFGGHLRPELFDENLPPNTPLKRGETPTKRRSLGTHMPAVLKKIIKEQPPPSGKDDAPEIRLGTPAQNALPSLPARTPTGPAAAHTHGARPPPSGPPCAQGPEPPRSGGRRSSGRPPRPSVGRSQLELLQAIHSKRRSGASEANLIVAKSWADVVRLSAKQAQTKVAKRGAQRPPSKRQRRSNTPKKPVGSVHHPSSTGHANSPCTIVIGKAHLEKVNAPARPCRMLNSFVFSRKVDFNEDLSGLTEMFKTPAKEKLPMTSMCPTTFSNSEDLLRKMFAAPNSKEETLLCTAKNSGETVFPSARNAPEEPSDETSTSPALRRQCFVVNGEAGRAPPEAEPLPAARSADKLGRSMELGDTQTPGAEGEPGVTPLREQKPEGELKESERSFETCRKNNRSEEDSGKTTAARRSRASELRRAVRPEDPVALGRLQDTDPEGARDNHGPVRSPSRAEEAGNTESRTTTVGSKLPEPEPFRTPAKVNIRNKTPSQKVNVEVLSAHRKRPHTPGESTNMSREAEGDEKDVKAFKETPEQKRNPAENAPGSRRRLRTPKRKVQALGELAGVTELLQKPDPTLEAVTNDKANNIPCRSPQVNPVITSTVMIKGVKRLLQKMDVEEALLALRKSPRAPGGTTCSPREPAGEEITKAFKATPEQKLELTENVTGRKGRPRTPQGKVQPLEDLAGFRELFQTPKPTVKPVADDKTKIPCKSPQAEPVTMPAGRKSRLKTSLGKVDMEEDISALKNPTPTPAETTHSHREAGGDDKDVNLKATPEQKLDPAENAVGSKRKPRTPKRKVQSLEELAGFRELFQTPDHTLRPVTDDKTNNIPCGSPQAEPVITSTVMTGWLKTPPCKVDVEEALSALRKSPRAPGGTTCSPREPAGEEITKAFKATPEQKLELIENVTGSKRRPRTPKGKVQALEDLAGFRELFQTPKSMVEPVTDDKTKIPCKSPQAEPVTMPAGRKSHLKASLGKVDMEEDISALRNPPPTPGETTHSHREAGGDDKDVNLKAIPEQKVDPAENAAGSRRRPRTPKRKVQSLEELAGLRELFQTPDHTVAAITDDKSNNIPCRSPKPEPINTSRKSHLKTPLEKVDMEEELSALRKPMPTPGGTTPLHREPSDDKEIRVLKATPEQKLDPAENAAGSKRKPRTAKRKVQSLGDLAGFRELFQTPDHTLGPVTDDKTNIPCKSPQAEPVITSTIMTKGVKTLLQKMDVEEALLALRKSPRAPGGTTCSPREPAGEEITKAFKATPEQKLELTENVTGSKRRPRTPKRKVQALEDLAGFRELFQTPKPTVEPVTDDETKIPCKSPQAEPVTMPTGRKSRLKTSLGKVDMEEDISALKNPTPTPAETTHSHREAGGDDKDVNLKQTPEQKVGTAENAAGSKRRPRTPKRKVQSLEELAGFRELFQTPDHTLGPVTDDKTNNIPCGSPQAEPVITSTVMTGWLKAPPCNVDVEEALLALRKSPRAPGGTTCSPREPAGEEITKALKATPEQKLELTENVTGSKRRPRTPQGKVQALEDLAGFRELFQTPKPTVEPVTDGETKIPCKSPQAEPMNTSTSRESLLETPLEKVGVEEELSAPRKPTPAPGGTAPLHREPGDDEDTRAFTATPEQKPELTEIVIGSKRRPRIPKGKVQAPEDLAGIEELFRTPDHAVAPVTDKTNDIPCKSPQAEPAGRKKRLKAPPGKVDIEVEPSALKKPTRTSRKTTRSHREPKGDDEDIKLFKKTSEQKADSAENVTRSKRRPRAPKEMARALGDLAGLKEPFQTPDHTDGQTAKMLHPSSRPDLGILAASKKRQRKAPAGEEDAEEEPAAPGSPTRTSGKSTRSRRAPAGGSRNASASQETAAQRPGPAESAAGSTRRLRTRTERPSPPEDPPGHRELVPAPGQDVAPGSDAESARRDPAQTRDRRKPAKTPRRGPRALGVQPAEDPARSQSGSVPRSPTRKRGKDENLAGAKRPRTRAYRQDAAEDPPLQKRQRTVPREGCPPPAPALADSRSRRLLADRTDLPGSTVSAKSKRRKAEAVVPPEKGMSLRSGRPNKTNGAEQGPGIMSAEKAPTRRNEKKTLKLRNLEDGAENPAPGDQAQGGGARLRPGRQRRVLTGAAGEAGESRARIHGDAREEKEGAKRSGRGCLRPRKVATLPAGDTSENEPKQRVTRSAKRSAENLTKENDNVCLRKIRTRSRRDNEDV